MEDPFAGCVEDEVEAQCQDEEECEMQRFVGLRGNVGLNLRRCGRQGARGKEANARGDGEKDQEANCDVSA